MANFKLNKLAAALHALVLIGLLGAVHGATTPPDKSKAAEKSVWNYSFTSLLLDGLSNLLVLSDFDATGPSGYAIKAGEARTTDANNFQNSRWTFTNKVQIATPDGYLTADKATVVFADNQISELHVSGGPATFEQHDTEKQTLAKGSAGTIDYDFKQNTVKLSDNAWLNYGQNECRAVAFVYNIATQVVSARPEDQKGQRIKCTATQNAGSDSSTNIKTVLERKAGAAKPPQ